MKQTTHADLNGDQCVVNLEFTDKGRAAFSTFTKKHVHEILAIVYDGQLLSAPRINEPVTDGMARISGGENLAEAKKVADTINAGALPLQLELVSIKLL